MWPPCARRSSPPAVPAQGPLGGRPGQKLLLGGLPLCAQEALRLQATCAQSRSRTSKPYRPGKEPPSAAGLRGLGWRAAPEVHRSGCLLDPGTQQPPRASSAFREGPGPTLQASLGATRGSQQSRAPDPLTSQALHWGTPCRTGTQRPPQGRGSGSGPVPACARGSGRTWPPQPSTHRATTRNWSICLSTSGL